MNRRFFNPLIYIATGILGIALGFLVFDRVVMRVVVRHNADILVPKVVGMEFEEAKKVLEEKKLRVRRYREEYSSDFPEGTVMFQVPRGNLMVKREKEVKLTVSLGSQNITVPELKGYSLRQAKFIIEEKKLTIGDTIFIEDKNIPEGNVVKTEPPGGENIPIGGKVTLYVSSGSRAYVTTPTFLGLSIDEAKELAKKNRLKIGRIKYHFTVAVEPQTVYRQSPEPGTRTYAGSSVSLTISTNNPQDTSEPQ
ncbi:PASTA domain-containing protein [bacterium]|nr:PASTA domain-containing protein [bacterium]